MGIRATKRDDAMLLKTHKINGKLIAVRPRMRVDYMGSGIGGRFSLVIQGLALDEVERLITEIQKDARS